MSESVDIRVRELEQRTHQVYDLSPWVDREDVEDKLLKYLKKLRITEEDVKEIVDMMGEKSVEEIAKHLRTKAKPVAAMDLHKIFEKLREQGYIRVITTKAPVKVTQVKTEVLATVVEAPPEEEVPAEIPAPEEIAADMGMEIPEVPMPDVPEMMELGISAEGAQIESVPVSPVDYIVADLKEKVDQIKSARIMDKYFEMNDQLKAIALLPREGNLILLSAYQPGVNIADAEVAVASTTIINHAANTAEAAQLGNLKELIVDSDNGYLLLAKLPDEIVLVAMFGREATLGLMIRDFLSLKNEISEILSSS